IPLPPATWQELQDAKDSGTMDETFNAWVYGGAWSTGGFPIAMDGMGPNSGDNPNLFREFEWTNVRILGVFFDNNTNVGGPIWLDNVYVGNAGLDLSAANDPAGPMTAVTYTASEGFNLIEWSSEPDFGGYKVYVSESAITDPAADGVQLLETLAFDDELSVEHMFELPSAEFSDISFYYAVTSLSFFGVENPDVSVSAGSLENPNLPIQPIILEMTDAEATTVFNNLAAGNVSPEGFPAVEPFRINASHQSQGDAALPPDDSDLSAEVWTGFSNLNEFFVYAEVTDDFIQLGSVVSGADAWQWDSIEMGWSNYDVRDAGGSILTSTPHQNFERGTYADYQFRIAAFDDENTGEIIGTSAFVAGSINADVQGGGVAYDVLDDGSGKAGAVIGWKVLALFPLNAIQSTADGDVVLAPPTGTETRLIAFNIALNDDDGSGREHQTQWSIKNNADGQWWNTPNQWPATAMSGRATQTSVDDAVDVPTTHALDQNYPNPFNPSTQIRFSLASSDLVTLKVFNVLGQEVATLLQGEPMTAGPKSVTFSGQGLSSGMYLYKLEAGSFSQTKQMILLK
ncbi:MAG: T9SS type A sorting domain-containing protein, partial [Rhodothermales bacterium]|nr:T9SS type A sorting domain-containing protein [Rhodothermales bacterium]